MALDLDDLALEERSHTPRTKAELDIQVSELSYDRRLAMAARRAADLFDYVSMPPPRPCCASSPWPRTSR